MNAMLRAALLALLGLLAAAAFAAAIDSDLSWQRALGEIVIRQHALPTTLGGATFTAPDARWLPHEWIFATIWALAERIGWEAGFRAGCALLALATVGIDAIRARGAAPRARAIALSLIVIGILPSFGLRAQILGWPLLALVMLVLEWGPRRHWLIVPIAILWDNLHASGLIVPAIVLIHGFGRVLTQRSRTPLVPTLALGTAAGLASVVTPFGLGYATFAAAWSINPATKFITEWQPVSALTLPLCLSAFGIAGLLVAGEFRGSRLSWSQRLLALALFGAALLHIRNIALFCIVAGPWAAAALGAILPRESPRVVLPSWSDRGLVALGAVGAVLIMMAGAKLVKPDPEDPTPAVAGLIAMHREARVACEDFSWCSRFAATPTIRVFIDGRVDAYPKSVFVDYRRLMTGDTAAVFTRWQIDAVLARRDGALARSLHSPRWQRVIGGPTQLFIRV